MNYLRRRLSDSSFVANLPNGYMMDLQRPPPPPASSTSSPASPATERRQPPSLAGQGQASAPASASGSGSFLSSFSSVVKSAQMAQSVAALRATRPSAESGTLITADKPDMTFLLRDAEFCEINLASYVNSGCMVDMQVTRGGTKVVRSFKPDFVLIRQHAYSMTPGEDFRSLVIGLQFGGVPSINSLLSIYNFCSKPWVFSHMIKLYHSLGPEKFPLNEQTFYPNHTQMVSTPSLPVVVKMGHAHAGMGKVSSQKYPSTHTHTHTSYRRAVLLALVCSVSVSVCKHEHFLSACLSLNTHHCGVPAPVNQTEWVGLGLPCRWTLLTLSALFFFFCLPQSNRGKNITSFAARKSSFNIHDQFLTGLLEFFFSCYSKKGVW
uniref:Synapsin III n=1 Tax=Myripristis murdjan TaxID=586833 RepID=A0A667WXT2_9TELE